MAYFPNGCAGEAFDEQCAKCIFFEMACPVAFVQTMYNYEACNNDVASKILGDLVSDDGTCAMFAMAPEIFTTSEAGGNVGPWSTPGETSE